MVVNRRRHPPGERHSSGPVPDVLTTAARVDTTTDSAQYFPGGVLATLEPSAIASAFVGSGNVVSVDDIDRLNFPTGGVDYDGDLDMQNIFTDPGFEDGTITGWVGDANTLIVNATVAAHSGSKHLHILRFTGSGTIVANSTHLVTAGDEYTFTAYIRKAAAADARSVHLEIQWYDKAGVSISTSTGSSSNSSNTYLLFRVEGTAPATAVSAIRRVSVASSDTNDGIFIDEVASWNRSKWLNLGWSFVSDFSSYIKAFLVEYNATDTVLFLDLEEEDDWSINSPEIIYDSNRSYDTRYEIKPTAGSVNHYARTVFNGLVDDRDGSEDAPIPTDSLAWTCVSSIACAGNGRTTAVDVVGLYAEFGKSEGINAANPGSVYVKNLEIIEGGIIEGHIQPVGPIARLSAGQMSLTDTTGNTAINSYKNITGFPKLITDIVAESTPQSVLDPTQSYLFTFTWGGMFRIDNITQNINTFINAEFAVDGTNYTDLLPARFSNGLFAGGTRDASASYTRHIYIPAGSEGAKLNLKFLHNLGVTATLTFIGVLAWTLIPA